jgi:hypothetical protein
MTADIEWEALRHRLEEEKSAVAAEIEAYPRPIAGCDAQFNHLLERRRSLWEELSRLEAARGEQAISPEDFLRSSTCLDQDAKRTVLDAREPAAGRPA